MNEKHDIQTQLVHLLESKKLKIATAESCTGGLISKTITEVSGASAVFDCGVCSYANSIKEKLLNVKKETLEAYGAVSEQTAHEMAIGILKLADADIGISVTGIAGPTGGTKEKPVGLVYIGVATRKGVVVHKCNFGEGEDTSRTHIRALCSLKALNLAFETVKKL